MKKSRPYNYDLLISQVSGLCYGESDIIANMANISAVIFHELPDINWAGFYLFKESQLVLGPFQGKPACIRIPIGKGVCGIVAETKKTLIVDDVHNFADHIACDAASNSEIVIPIVKNDVLIGVLDVDSPNFSRFDEFDAEYLGKVVDILISSISLELFSVGTALADSTKNLVNAD